MRFLALSSHRENYRSALLHPLLARRCFCGFLSDTEALIRSEDFMLEVRDISYHIGNARILRGISAQFQAGVFSVIVGPNGSGKSTLLKIMSGEHTPSTGNVQYDNKPIDSISNRDRAKSRAVLSQHTDLS